MNGLLLDTHVFIWFCENSPDLPNKIRDQIESADRVYLSIASLWEIAIKISIGRLPFQINYHSIEAGLPSLGIELIDIAVADITHLLHIPLHHRDPFDRLLIAQTIERQLILVSADKAFRNYDIQILW